MVKFRIHCANVMTAMLAFRQKVKAATENTTEYEDATNERKSLRVIFRETKCYEQLCTAIQAILPAVRQGASNTDQLVVFQDELE